MRLFAEHHARGGGHSLQFAAIGDQVEIRFEDLPLGPAVFERERGFDLNQLLPQLRAGGRRESVRRQQRRQVAS